MPAIDFESYRVRRALRFFTYGLMTMATVVLTSIVILLSMGYRFDREQFGLEQNGLLQLSAQPVDARYTLNGKAYKNLTPDKQTLPAGSYNIEMRHDGYRAWQREIAVLAGHVHWINYPRLIPTSLTSKNVKDYEDVGFAKLSPDKRWLLVNPGTKDKDKLELIDFKDPKKPTTQVMSIPESQLTKKDDQLGKLGFIEWSLDSKTFLITHTVGDTTEYLKLERERPTAAININKKFQLVVHDAHFSGGDSNIIYAQTGAVLRRFDISDNTASGALMDGVKEFEIFGTDTIVFRRLAKSAGADKADAAATQEVGIRLKNEDIIVQQQPVTADLSITYGEFDHHSYFALANRTEKTVAIYQDVNNAVKRTQTFATFTGHAPTTMGFSPTSRFLQMQQDGKFAVYDFYEQQKFGYDIDGLQKGFTAQWLDGYHLVAVKNGKLQMWDFDGFNQQELVAAAPGVDAVLDEDDDILFTINKAEAGSSTSRPFSLTTTSLLAQ